MWLWMLFVGTKPKSKRRKPGLRSELISHLARSHATYSSLVTAPVTLVQA